MVIRPDGLVAGRLRQHAPGVLVRTVDTRRELYDASGPWRARALRGVLHSGRLVRDRRSRDRRGL
jgi:apolipoprotein N-acyltransferase